MKRQLGKFSIYLLIVGVVAAALLIVGRMGLVFDRRQMQSLTIFAAFVAGMILYDRQRLAFAFAGVALLLALRLLSIPQLVASSNLNIILFLLGIFLVVGFLEQHAFFESIVHQLVGAGQTHAFTLVAKLMASGLIISALFGELAAMLVIGSAVMQLSRRFRFNAGWLLMLVVFAINTGSAASPFGPIGVIISTKAGLTPLAFVRWAVPVSLAVLGLVLAIGRWWFTEELARLDESLRGQADVAPCAPARQLKRCWLVSIATLGVLLFHAQIEHALALPRDVMLVGGALAGGALALFLSPARGMELIEQDVDWAAVSFLMMLFAAVGAMEATGVTRTLAGFLIDHTSHHAARLTVAIGWGAGVLSALLDNMAAVTSFLAVADHIRASQALPASAYWLLLFGGALMGNMTFIGSASNILAGAMYQREYGSTIGFWQWFKIGFVVSISSMLLATLILGMQTGWFAR